MNGPAKTQRQRAATVRERSSRATASSGPSSYAALFSSGSRERLRMPAWPWEPLSCGRRAWLSCALLCLQYALCSFDVNCSILLDSCVLFHQLLQTVAGKAYRELSILAIAFATEHRSAAVLGMPDHGAGAEAATASGWPRDLRRHGGARGWGAGTLRLDRGWWRGGRFPALREELLNVIHGVVCFAGVEIGPDGLSLHLRRAPGALAGLAEVFHQRSRNLAQESGGDGGFLLAATEAPAIARRRQEQPLLGARHADVTKTALFFHGGFRIQRANVREQSLFHSSQEHDGKLQAFGVVQREQRDGGALIQVVGVGDQRRVI